VKDQGQCGSCFAFSATEALESAWVLAGNSPIVFAPQQVVSCDRVGQDNGCNGGNPDDAYTYINQCGGFEKESDYPYTSGQTQSSGTCTFDSSKVAAQFSGTCSWVDPPCNVGQDCNGQSEQNLEDQLQSSPISICINAEPFQDYTSGTIQSNCSNDPSKIDHCIQLVGYNNNVSPPYWIIRNSWGTDWGNSGYVYIAKGMKNLCGVGNEATVPNV